MKYARALEISDHHSSELEKLHRQETVYRTAPREHQPNRTSKEHRVFAITAEGLTRAKPTPAQPLAKHVTSAPKLDILPECASQSLPRNQPGTNHKRHQGAIDLQTI